MRAMKIRLAYAVAKALCAVGITCASAWLLAIANKAMELGYQDYSRGCERMPKIFQGEWELELAWKDGYDYGSETNEAPDPQAHNEYGALLS